MTEFWPITEAAKRCRLGQRTIERAIAAGELPAYKVGRRTLLAPGDVCAWITSRPVRAGIVGGAA